MKSFSALSAGFVLVAITTVFAGVDPVQSRWRPDDLRIDGVISEWPVQTFLSKEIAASVVNDAQDLYVLVATADTPAKTQITRAGLAIYLDPKGGKSHGFGIRIPPIGNRLEPGNAPAGPQPDPTLLSYFDRLGPGDDESRRVELPDPSGIDLRIGMQNSTFLLELKVPFAVAGIKLDRAELGMAIVTPEPPRLARPRRPGGRGGAFPNLGGGPPPQDKGKEIDLWTKVILAKAK